MKIVLKDIFGKERINRDYESLVDCMFQNKSNLSYIDFRLVDFSDADFSDADFKLSYFSGADFSGADFRSANFCGANFRSANFRRAIFRRAIFEGVNFNKSNFGGGDFKGCYFSNVDLSGIDISCKMLYDIYCSDTKLDYRLLKIQGSRHLFCGYGGMVKIGCEYHSVDDWLAHGAYTDEYSKSKRDEYMEYIKIYSKIWEGER